MFFVNTVYLHWHSLQNFFMWKPSNLFSLEKYSFSFFKVFALYPHWYDLQKDFMLKRYFIRNYFQNSKFYRSLCKFYVRTLLLKRIFFFIKVRFLHFIVVLLHCRLYNLQKKILETITNVIIYSKTLNFHFLILPVSFIDTIFRTIFCKNDHSQSDSFITFRILLLILAPVHIHWYDLQDNFVERRSFMMK